MVNSSRAFLTVMSVKNGWIVAVHSNVVGERGTEYVFTNPDSLGKFITNISQKERESVKPSPENKDA